MAAGKPSRGFGQASMPRGPIPPRAAGAQHFAACATAVTLAVSTLTSTWCRASANTLWTVLTGRKFAVPADRQDALLAAAESAPRHAKPKTTPRRVREVVIWPVAVALGVGLIVSSPPWWVWLSTISGVAHAFEGLEMLLTRFGSNRVPWRLRKSRRRRKRRLSSRPHVAFHVMSDAIRSTTKVDAVATGITHTVEHPLADCRTSDSLLR